MVKISIDTVAPAGEIRIKDNSFTGRLLNIVNFRYFSAGLLMLTSQVQTIPVVLILLNIRRQRGRLIMIKMESG